MTFGIRGNINKPELPAVTYRLIKELNRKKIDTITATRVSNMLNTYMQPLLDISVANNLLHQNTDGTFRDVEHHTRLSVVVFVWQSFLLG